MRERFGLDHFAVFDSAVSNREVLPGIGVIGKIPDCDTVLLLVRELVDGKAPSRKLDPNGRFIKSSISLRRRRSSYPSVNYPRSCSLSQSDKTIWLTPSKLFFQTTRPEDINMIHDITGTKPKV
jgi:hypothetical protein